MNDFILANGVEVPSLGLGAEGIWEEDRLPRSKHFNNVYEIYAYALESGKCRLFDTSESYGLNETAIGEAFRDTNKRKEVVIMTKIGNESQRGKGVRAALEGSLSRLKTDYIDVYLLHWPQTGTFLNSWLEMEKLYEEGIVKAIGVCNCNKHHLAAIRNAGNITPMINEFEIHPLFTQEALVSYCYAKDIQVVASTPLARMHDVLMKAGPIRVLSEKYNVTKVQLILRWHFQLGRVTIPRTLNKKHFDEFFAIDRFEITDKDMAWISSLNDNIRTRFNPDTCDFSILG